LSYKHICCCCWWYFYQRVSLWI